jgi:hypothetical protein
VTAATPVLQAATAIATLLLELAQPRCTRQAGGFARPTAPYPVAGLLRKLGSLTLHKPCCGTLFRMPNSLKLLRSIAPDYSRR